MKSRLSAIITLLLALLPLFCQGKESRDTISARRAFVELPVIQLELLSPDSRLDMLDYFDNDSIYKANNNLHGTSYLTAVTPDYLNVQITPVSDIQVKVLTLGNGSQIVMTIYSTGLPGRDRDSEVAFYDTAMNQLPADKYFKTPALADFFDTKGYKTQMKEIEGMLPFYNVSLQAYPDSDDLTARLSYQDILTVEDAAIVQLLLKPQLLLLWNGKKYSLR